MALPILAIVQAITTLTPLFKKNSLSEKEDAKKVLSANNGPVSSSIGNILMGGGVVYASVQDAVIGVVTSLVGLGFYLYNHRND